jgi:hypothetical protein
MYTFVCIRTFIVQLIKRSLEVAINKIYVYVCVCRHLYLYMHVDVCVNFHVNEYFQMYVFVCISVLKTQSVGTLMWNN